MRGRRIFKNDFVQSVFLQVKNPSSKSMSLGSERCQGVTNFVVTSGATSRINHIADFKAVKLTGGANSVRSHVVESEPISDL